MQMINVTTIDGVLEFNDLKTHWSVFNVVSTRGTLAKVPKNSDVSPSLFSWSQTRESNPADLHYE